MSLQRQNSLVSSSSFLHCRYSPRSSQGLVFGVSGHMPSSNVVSLKIYPGLFEVTGVNRSFFSPKMLILLKITWYGNGNHACWLATLYISYGSNNSPRVIWGHRGQKVVFAKMLFLHHITWYDGMKVHLCW